MELREYWRIFRRRAWIPALLLIVTVATATALVFLSKPQYIATATVLARNSTTTSGLTFQQVVSSNSLALRVIQELRLNQSVDQLSSRIKVVSAGSNLYAVAVTDRDPDVATVLANQVAKDATAIYLQLAIGSSSTVSTVGQDLLDALTSYRDKYGAAERALIQFNQAHPQAAAGQGTNLDLLVQSAQLQLDAAVAHDNYSSAQTDATNGNLTGLTTAANFDANVVDPAAARADTSGRFLKVGYAAALALILGVGLIFLLEYLDNSVREPEAVEELVGAPVVGIIPRASGRALRPAKGAA